MEQVLEHKFSSILKKENIEFGDDENIIKKLAYHTYTMVFNICAIIATHTLIYEKKDNKVTLECIKITLDYITKKCYSKKAKVGDDAVVDLYNEMRSSEIASQLKTGGGINAFSVIFTRITPNKELFPSTYIKDIFDSFEVSISPKFIKDVKHVLKMHLSCLLADIKRTAPVLTTQKLEKILKLKRHSIYL